MKHPHLAYTLGMAGAFGAAAVVASLAVMPTLAAADDITADPGGFISATDRAAVRGDLLKRPSAEARALVPKSDYTRAEARSAYVSSRDEVRAINAEDSGSSYLKRKPVDPTRMMGAPAQ